MDQGALPDLLSFHLDPRLAQPLLKQGSVKETSPGQLDSGTVLHVLNQILGGIQWLFVYRSRKKHAVDGTNNVVDELEHYCHLPI